jgi:Flp pilus assembly protein TadD
LYPYRYNIQAKKQQIEDWFSVSVTLPSHTQAHFGLGMILDKMGRTEEAQLHFREALKYRVLKPANLDALGQLCLQKRWFAEAATNFSDSIRLDPADPRAHLALGDAFEGLGRPAEAREQYATALGQFQRILQNDPTNAVALRWTQVIRTKLPGEPPH